MAYPNPTDVNNQNGLALREPTASKNALIIEDDPNLRGLFSVNYNGGIPDMGVFNNLVLDYADLLRNNPSMRASGNMSNAAMADYITKTVAARDLVNLFNWARKLRANGLLKTFWNASKTLGLGDPGTIRWNNALNDYYNQNASNYDSSNGRFKGITGYINYNRNGGRLRKIFI